MPVQIKNENGVMRAAIAGDIDHHMAGGLRGEIDAAVMAELPRTLLLDFKDVTFMDSSGIGLVMGRYRLQSEHGGELRVANPSPQIKKVMKLAGLDRLAKIE